MKILEELKRKDLRKHFIWGFILTTIVVIFKLWQSTKEAWVMDSLWEYLPKFQVVLTALFVGAFVGIFKEFFWDLGISRIVWVQEKFKVKLGCFDWADLKWTIYGSLVAGIILWIAAFFVPSLEPTKIKSDEDYFKERIEQIHKNDPKSFENDSKELKSRSDSLLYRNKMR